MACCLLRKQAVGLNFTFEITGNKLIMQWNKRLQITVFCYEYPVYQSGGTRTLKQPISDMKTLL